MKLTKCPPKKSGWYWVVRKVMSDIHNDEVRRYKNGNVFLAPPFETVRGMAVVGYYRASQKKTYAISFLSLKKPTKEFPDGSKPFIWGAPTSEIALWSDKQIEPPPEWRRYLPMTKKHLDLARRSKIRKEFILEWQNKK